MDAIPRLAKVLRLSKQNHTIGIPECFPPFPLIPLMAYHRTVIKDVYVRYSILAISVRMFPPHPLIPLMAYYRTLIKYVHVLYLSY